MLETTVAVIHLQTLLYLARFYVEGVQTVTVAADLEHFNKVTFLDKRMRDSPISLAGEFDTRQFCNAVEMLLATNIASSEGLNKIQILC